MSVCRVIPIPKCRERERERVIALRSDVARRWMSAIGVRLVAHGALFIHNLGAA